MLYNIRQVNSIQLGDKMSTIHTQLVPYGQIRELQ